MIPSHILPDFKPVPDPDAIVKAPNLRITVLTTRLLRIEYCPNDKFEDRPSQPFWYRNLPVPEFEANVIKSPVPNGSQEALTITTSDLILNIAIGEQPSPETLFIYIFSMDRTWHFNDTNQGNLKGTYRTLDTYDGNVPLEQGLISRDGWTLIDDTNSLVFNNEGWLEPRNTHPDAIDLYFFGYGHDYQSCISDYRKISGEVPLLPRWALGNWWSRYWQYSQDQIIELIQDFQDHEIPLSVFIIDMDWHITDTGNSSTGWTGYSWNRKLIPEPKTLIRHLHEKRLKTALNLHPAEGVHPHEDQYSDFAKHMGVPPDSRKPIPFDITDPVFTSAYFNLLHHPKEDIGVDFWWIDWQQGVLSSMPKLDPLWWLNHLHFMDIGRIRIINGNEHNKRPFIFSRWGGLGNHRYPIGFSGDTVISWKSLAYQPYFTATAANVSYGWWSHDIGGHMSGIEDPENFTRWVQYGVFSPIFRLHCTNNPIHERRPYAYDAQVSQLTSHAMRLRHTFIPYLYSMAWQDHTGSITPIRPLYHLAPDSEPAYHTPDTYTFGSELIAAPHIFPIDSETQLSRKKIWLPEGRWYNYFSGFICSGGHHVVYGDLTDIPLFAKEGAIVPCAPISSTNGADLPTHLDVNIFTGADNQFNLYEDDGESNNYLKGEYANTPFLLREEKEQLIFTIGPVEGKMDVCPETRTYSLKIFGTPNPTSIHLLINQKPIDVNHNYDQSNQTLFIRINHQITPNDQMIMVLKMGGEFTAPDQDLTRYTMESCKHVLSKFHLESYIKLGILENLPGIIKNPELLMRTRPSVSNAQLRALLEIITRAGVHRYDHTGEDVIELWNENPIQEKLPVTYHLSVNQLDRGYYKNPYHYEGGPVPGYKVLQPQKHFGANPWELRIRYGNILTVRYSSELDTSKSNQFDLF